MNRSQHRSSIHKAPVPAPVHSAHLHQLERLASLTRLPVLPDVPFVDRKTQGRATEVLGLLWDRPPPELLAILSETFVTVIGGGDVQLEWMIGDRYFEVEIPSEGPLPFYYEVGSEEIESASPSPSKLVDIFRKFWRS